MEFQFKKIHIHFSSQIPGVRIIFKVWIFQNRDVKRTPVLSVNSTARSHESVCNKKI